MEEPDLEPMSDPFPPVSVHLAPFSPAPAPSARRLSSYFTGPSRPVQSACRRLAYMSLQGVLVNAEEASSARSICRRGGRGLSREEAVAWELFTPIQRFLIVAVIGVAVAESKKNGVIQKLQKSVDLRDQVLSSMQQKLDDLCKQLNLIKDQSRTGPEVSDKTNARSTFKENFGSEKIKFIDCGCWLCDQHHHLLPGLGDKPLMKASTGHEMLNETTNLVIHAEPEERRMSDMSDWCSSVTSAAEVHFNDLSLDQDMLYLRKECQEKDTTIKELTSFLQSTNKAGSKRISELEDIIRRKNMIITRLKKDMLVLEQKVTQLSRLRRSSSAAAISNSRELPIMMDNLLYDMDITSSPSSSDSETPTNESQTPVLRLPDPVDPVKKVDSTSEQSCKPLALVVKLPELVDLIKEVDSTSEQSRKSAPAKPSFSLVKSVKSRSVSPLRELSMNQKPVSVSSSSRQRRVVSVGDSKKSRRPVQITSRDSTGSRKRWV